MDIKLFEYAYDQPTLTISRWAINMFKKFISDEEADEIGSYYTEADALGKKIKVALFIMGTHEIKSRTSGLFEDDEHRITMEIRFRIGKIKEDFNSIVAQIKEVTRHELEHLGQSIKPNKEKVQDQSFMNMPEPGKKEMNKYLNLEDEVAAFVKGLLKKAKTQRVPLSQEIDAFVDKFVNSKNITKGQGEKIRIKYKDYAQKTLQNYENTMTTVQSFEDWKLNEANGIKALVGKTADEDLTVQDAKRIGAKISKMAGKSRQKYIGIVNFMGASCKVFNEIWANYKPVDKQRATENDDKEYTKPEVPAAV